MNTATADRSLFAQVAPRLERAHRERIIELVAERAARHQARNDVLKAEWLVAHRELQYERACNTRRASGGYADARLRKLDAARGQLRRARARAERLGA